MTWQPLDATHGDPLAVVIPYLRTQLSPVRVSVSLDGWRRPDPIVQLHRTGGSVSGVNDEGEYQVDVRADDYDACQDLAKQVRRWLRLAPSAPGLVRGSRELRGPDWTSDEDGKPRVRMDWMLVVEPEVP